jgi:hypothetical protein
MPVKTKVTKIPIEFDEPEAVVILEEKTEEDPLATEEESSEIGIDETGMEDEVDPFNDKWEA